MYSLALLFKLGVPWALFAVSQAYPHGNVTLHAGQGVHSMTGAKGVTDPGWVLITWVVNYQDC